MLTSLKDEASLQYFLSRRESTVFSVLTHVDTSGELISVGSWVSPPVSPEKPLRSEHRLCWWPGGPPGEPPRPGGSEQEGRSEPRGFTPARGQRCCHWAAGGRALSGVATRWALKEACRLEVGRGCCGGRGSWERRAFVGRGAGAPTETFLWSGARSTGVAAAAHPLQFSRLGALPRFLFTSFPL